LQAAGGRDRLVLGRDDLGAGHRQPGGVEQPGGELLVRCDVDRDPARATGHRRADPLLVDALAELDEAVAVEADVRDVAAGRLVEEGLRGRAECEPLGEPDQVLELGDEVERVRRVAGRHQVVDEPDGHPAGRDADLLLAILVDHVVAAVLAGAPGLAVADVGAGEVLELERDVLRDVAGPGAIAQPGDEAAAAAERARVVLERGQHLDERVHEARDPVARELLEHAQVHDLADDRLARPVVGAAQDPGLEDAQGRLGAGAAGRVGGAAAGGRPGGLRGWRRGACVAGLHLARPSPGSGFRLRHLSPPRVPGTPECTRRGLASSVRGANVPTGA
jgi:hypothetical protein